jgi:uracil-DNA glycosylase
LQLKKTKIILLKKIAEEINRCRECKKDKSGLPVPGEGDPDATLMFIGEAPGREEARTGRPFIGRSGKLLTRMLAGVKINRENVYITSPVKYYPGKRAPTPKEITHGKKHLIAQIEIIKPKLLVLLGATAMKALLKGKYQVTKVHGKTITENGQTYFLTFHPAAALRFPKIIGIKMVKDLKSLPLLIKNIA